MTLSSQRCCLFQPPGISSFHRPLHCLETVPLSLRNFKSQVYLAQCENVLALSDVMYSENVSRTAILAVMHKMRRYG